MKQPGEDLRLFLDVTKVITASLDPKEVFDLIVNKIPQILHVDAATIRLLDPSARKLVLEAASGLSDTCNWKAITAYLKDRARRMTVFTPDFSVALIVTLMAALGTYFMVPPFSCWITLSERIKDGAAVKYGAPPYGHAELSSLKTFTQKLDLDLASLMQPTKVALPCPWRRLAPEPRQQPIAYEHLAVMTHP